MTGPTLVLLSDTHGHHGRVRVPDGDILIHAGDLTHWGSMQDVESFDRFLAALPHKHKVIIAGNHDFCFQQKPAEARGLLRHGIYLEDQAVELEGIKIYGSPWQPMFCNLAFNLPRGEKLRQVWSRIPDDTELLITHCPPYGEGDYTRGRRSVGCEDLLQRIGELPDLRLHVFGHIHEACGITRRGGITFVNASICDLSERPAQPPVVVRWHELGVATA